MSFERGLVTSIEEIVGDGFGVRGKFIKSCLIENLFAINNGNIVSCVFKSVI